MKRTITTAGAVCLFLAACALANVSSVSAEERNFNALQAVEFALQNNGELKALREEKGIREAGKIKAGLFPNPVLEMDGTTGELTGSKFENTVSVGISQELLTVGKRGKRLKVAEKEIESFDSQVDNSARILREEVKTSFYDLLLAEKKVELAKRSITLNNQLFDVTKQRFEVGDIPELEVNLARVEVARSQGRKVEAERELSPTKARLLALLGISSSESATFSGNLEVATFTKNLEDLKVLALKKRPDLKALEAEKAKGEAEVTLAQAERIPNVTLGLGYQRENSAIDVSGEEIKTRDNLLGLKISIPIPLFDRNQSGIMEAKARRAGAENRALYARNVVERDVESAYARLTAADKSLAIYAKDIIPQLEENLKLVQEAYRLGEVGILTVVEEQKKFFEVNDGYLTALYNRQVALVKLESVVGGDLIMDNTGGGK